MRFSLVANNQLRTFDTSEALIPWWSFTKTVLAAAALTLVEEGRVGLDEPVAEGPFTLRQLLRHQAGLADYSALADYHTAVARGDAPWAPEEMLQRLDTSRLRYAPGAGWGYSNLGYLYVARLLERVTGLSLEDALRQRVLAPLGLTRVRLAKTPQDLQQVVMGAASTYDPGWVYHGLLVGPLEQACLLLDLLLDGHLIRGPLLAQMQAALRLGGAIPGRPWSAPGYGLGLMQGEVGTGLTLCGHTGVGPGSVVAVYRSQDGQNTATCAVFCAGGAEGPVEFEVVRHLRAALEGAGRVR